MKLVQISDTHVSHRGGVTNNNLERTIRYINEVLKPDVVIHTGDVSILSPDDADDRRTAHELLAGIEAPLRVLPGNHDVGEPGEAPWAGFGATSARTEAFTAVFGPDHWLDVVDGYALVGLNSEILSTGTPQEQDQWDWLAGLRDQIGERPALVFCHKPFWSPVEGETEHTLAIPDDAREKLVAAFEGITVLAYGSGHLHHYGIGRRGDALTVSAPSTAFLAGGDDLDVGLGLKQLGVVEYLCTDGTARAFFRSVPDLVEGSPMGEEAFTLAAAEIGIVINI